ncbi:MAG TPA: hypothetical protein VFN35_18585 [Ktedonobacteraceae bacterium]|nr:hypothetical protein [Ktedonobacteraceae bacterium]
MNKTIESIGQQELAAAREQATRIIQFARKDATFRQKASQDPAGVLRAFGFPEHAGATLPRKADSHLFDLPCTELTCWSSECPSTCYITLIVPPPKGTLS